MTYYDPERNAIDCIDLQFIEGMTMRDLRLRLADICKRTPLELGLGDDASNRLFDLDEPVTLSQKILLIVGPYAEGQSYGPAISTTLAFMWNTAEALESISLFMFGGYD